MNTIPSPDCEEIDMTHAPISSTNKLEEKNENRSYIYTILWSIKCEIVLCLKKYTPLLKNPLLLKNAVI